MAAGTAPRAAAVRREERQQVCEHRSGVLELRGMGEIREHDPFGPANVQRQSTPLRPRHQGVLRPPHRTAGTGSPARSVLAHPASATQTAANTAAYLRENMFLVTSHTIAGYSSRRRRRYWIAMSQPSANGT